MKTKVTGTKILGVGLCLVLIGGCGQSQPRSKAQNLGQAILFQDVKAVEKFIKEEPDQVNAKNRGYAPLHTAASKGYADIVKLLLEGGANVRVRDDFGNTPLQSAAYKGHIKVAELLLQSGADINDPGTDLSNGTPLYAAVMKNQVEMVKFLIGQGANVNKGKPQHGMTPLDFAKAQGYKEVMDILKQHGGVHGRGR